MTAAHVDREPPHRRSTNPDAVGGPHCQRCGASSGWPCPPVAAAERAVVEAQADADLERRLAALGPVLTATTEGSTR